MERVFEIVSKVSTPLGASGIVIAALFFIFREIIKKNIFPTLTRNLSSEIIKLVIQRLYVLGLVSLVLGFLGYGMGLFSPYLNLSAIYRIRVMITDPENQPVNDAEITSTPDGERKQLKGGWQIDIPGAAVPKDRKLTLSATEDNGLFIGSSEFILGDDHNPSIAIKLRRETSARIRGQVIAENGEPISQATVYIENYLEERVITPESGVFDLPAHAAAHEHIRLFVRKNGYQIWNDFLPAGGDSLAKITLFR